MPVATFVQPNYNTQTGTAYPLNIDAAFAAFLRLAGTFAPHEQATPNMTVRLDAGHVFNGTSLTESAPQSTGTIAAPSTNPRKDIVYVDRATGAVGVATGVQSASPVDPAIPAGKVPVARVNLATSTTVIVNSILDDIRDLNLLGLGTAATRNTGTGANQIVELDGSARLPAVDGSQLTGVVSVPTGAVMPYAGSSAPSGWLFCAGQAVSRTTFAALFAAVGTTYGAGDGSTTFNLPDLRGRAAVGKDDMGGTAASRITTAGSGIAGATLGASGGAETVTIVTAGMPSHAHDYWTVKDGTGPPLTRAGAGNNANANGVLNLASNGLAIEATGGGGAHQNMTPALILNYIIKA